MQVEGDKRWIRIHQRGLAYVTGVAVVCIWTLLRFFTKRTIFDLISQQVIVHQWLHDQISPAHMGQTAYVPKMLFLYAPLDILPGSPRLKLVLLTLAINIATFVFIGLIAEKLLREFHVRTGWVFYAALVWLSTIAGSVFWIEFANSRNLEVAGGLLLLYWGIRFLRQPEKRLGFAIAALGSVLFFGDPLQVYMTAVPLALYAGILALTKRRGTRIVVTLCGLLVVGLVVSRLLFAITGHWLQLSFTDTGQASAPHVSAVWLVHSTDGTLKSTLSLLAGANDAGRLREVANIGLFLLGCLGLTYSAAWQLIPRRLLLLVGCIWVVDIFVYMASGQAVHGAATSRYLIMTMPALMLAFGAIRLPQRAFRPAVVIAAIIFILNLGTLTSALTTHWGTTFPADNHLASTYRYVQHKPNVHFYASDDTATPVLFLHGLAAERVLPVGCLHGRLVQTHYSMDQAFARDTLNPNVTAAIVLDGKAVTNTPNVCTIESITHQFGPPQSLGHTDDGSIVLMYTQSAIQLPE